MFRKQNSKDNLDINISTFVYLVIMRMVHLQKICINLSQNLSLHKKKDFSDIQDFDNDKEINLNNTFHNFKLLDSQRGNKI